ncbi:MAG: hypothetical protein J6Z31_09615 [Fibrobacter sp.]|nr:hypothetical protein [Fibrobacter sp.]
MISEVFLSSVKKQKNRLVIYPNDLFDQRVQEEMIRADEYKSYFVYAEIDFGAVRKALPNDQEGKFWDAVFKSFATKGRGSDVIGMLENDEGIGVIMLDSKMDGWDRLVGRIKEFSKNSISNIENPLGTIKAFVYPAYIDTESPAAAQESIS